MRSGNPNTAAGDAIDAIITSAAKIEHTISLAIRILGVGLPLDIPKVEKVKPVERRLSTTLLQPLCVAAARPREFRVSRAARYIDAIGERLDSNAISISLNLQ